MSENNGPREQEDVPELSIRVDEKLAEADRHLAAADETIGYARRELDTYRKVLAAFYRNKNDDAKR